MVEQKTRDAQNVVPRGVQVQLLSRVPAGAMGEWIATGFLNRLKQVRLLLASPGGMVSMVNIALSKSAAPGSSPGPSATESGAERSATGLENRAGVKPEGSIPSLSANMRR